MDEEHIHVRCIGQVAPTQSAHGDDEQPAREGPRMTPFIVSPRGGQGFFDRCVSNVGQGGADVLDVE